MDKTLKYFNDDALAASVWKGKYSFVEEETPDDMHRRMAKEFSRIEDRYKKDLSNSEWNRLSHYGRHRDDLTENSIYQLFKHFKYIVPQGSVMSTLGTDKIASLSNCFVVGRPFDSYGGIMQKDEQLAQLMKRRGGVGIDISSLRPSETEVANAAKTSTGAVSFMERYSNTTREVAQDGRRGALMISIDIRHPDVEKFATIKQDLTKVTGANVSIQLRDDFMKAVENNEDYILRWPCEKGSPFKLNLSNGNISQGLDWEYNKLIEFDGPEGKVYYKKIKARELWSTIVKCAHNTAEPGLIFLDKHYNYSPDSVYEKYKGVTTNPCFSGEMQLLTAYGYKKFKDLEGQEIDLIDHEGNIKEGRVIKTGVKPTCILKLSNGKTIETTNDHKFVTTSKEEIQAQFLKEGKYRLLIPYELNREINEFTKYGFLQGDGCLGRLDSKNHLGIEVYIGEKDLDVAKLFNLNDSGKHYINGFNATLKELRFDSKQLPYRELPLSIDNWEKNNLSRFLKGLWSANGSIIKEQRISFKSTCKPLIDKLKDLLKINYNIDSYITTNKAKNVQFSNGNYVCKESYDLNISKLEDIVFFAKEIGFIHEYKQILLEELILAKCPLVISSKIGEIKEVFDFQINSDKHWGIVEGVIVHNCGEIFMGPYDACRLLALNFFSFVKNPFTKDASIDLEALYKISYEQQRLADGLVDLEVEHIDRIIEKIKSDPEPAEIKRNEIELWENIKDIAQSSRRTGCGFTALGDTLAALGIKYDSEEGINVTEKIMRTKFQGELDCTIDLAIVKGPFVGWDVNKEYDAEGNGINEFYKFLDKEFPEQVALMKKYGRRNVSWSTVAPTGSVSILTQTTSGLEPLFSPYYMRRKKVNPNDQNVRIDFTDQNGDNWQEYPILHPKFKEWVLLQTYDFLADNLKGSDNLQTNPQNYYKEQINTLFENSPWSGSTANDIDWKNRIAIQEVIQKYTTHSISTTLNLPNDTSLETISDIYFLSWKHNLKGQTIYRDGCRTGVLVTNDSKQSEFDYRDAPKRPKTLDCDIFNATSQGANYHVFVGLYNDKPYEVFARRDDMKLDSHEPRGTLTKNKQSEYEFKSEGLHFVNILANMTNTQEAYTRLISTALRHGADIKFIVEQLQKAEGELNSFAKVIARILKKYIPDGTVSTLQCSECGSKELIFQEGCQVCKSCGNSKCG